MGITEFLATNITLLIERAGYLGVGFLMMLESMIFPIPSEAVMPFAGRLIAQGKMSWWGVLAFSSLGSVTGSLLSYWMGKYGGRPFINLFGKYLLLNREDLDKTERYFSRFGGVTIFVCRFIPVVRHLISIPAGLANMALGPFIILTAIGATMWNMFLAWAGVVWEQNWDAIMAYRHIIDNVVVLGLLAFVVYFIVKHIKPRGSRISS